MDKKNKHSGCLETTFLDRDIYDQKLQPAMLTFHVAGDILLWTQVAAIKSPLFL